jgi:hypothetical protein
MVIMEGSAFVAVCVPPIDWSRGGKGGGCLLFLASCWVEAAPCRGDVIPIVTCRNVSGYADEHVVNIHEGDRVIIQLCSAQERILSYLRCYLLARWLFYDFGGASASCRETAAWTTRATAQEMQTGEHLHSKRVFPIVHSAPSQSCNDTTQAKSQYFPIRSRDTPIFVRTCSSTEPRPRKGPHLTGADHRLPHAQHARARRKSRKEMESLYPSHTTRWSRSRPRLAITAS